jgi:hypothetical protein
MYSKTELDANAAHDELESWHRIALKSGERSM